MIRWIGIIGIISLFISCGKPSEDDFREGLLTEVNMLRKSGCWCGDDSMPPVQEVEWDELLELAAIRHVEDMSQNRFLNHYGSDGSTPYSRITDAGFDGSFFGENIARGYVTIQDVVGQWKNSPEHCKIMMDNHYHFMAVAYESYYWVQLFGSE
ncbi:MAG: CAP domain-containing protein [Bacteroidales bacterium]|nr:CAP domain-containing protein [Bacteroidales bacterium]